MNRNELEDALAEGQTYFTQDPRTLDLVWENKEWREQKDVNVPLRVSFPDRSGFFEVFGSLADWLKGVGADDLGTLNLESGS